ncbi:MAG: non-heme iron oxygenase ferredoxin subunit [Gemmatimonadales bacterium]|jgi:3-phenylpropionate/trans-cinnamate dioxygenase ferredoxin subunit
MSEFTTVASLADVPESGLKTVQVNGNNLVLVRRDGRVYALEDRCSHEEFPLSAGEVTGDQITCALHGARFDLASGTPKALPAVLPVRTFECRVEGDEVQVRL